MDGHPVSTWILLALLASSGCTTPARVEQLEARLREQQDQIETLDGQLAGVRSDEAALRRQRDGLLQQVNGTSGTPAVRPEQADLLLQATGVQINPWLTGGNNTDQRAGDDELVVLLQPQDNDGEPVKLPGTIRFELIDPAIPANSRQLGSWSFTPSECREHWHQSLLARGFLFHLPWQSTPVHRRLLLHADYLTGDGRRFNTDRLIEIDTRPSHTSQTPHFIQSENPELPPVDSTPATTQQTRVLE